MRRSCHVTLRWAISTTIFTGNTSTPWIRDSLRTKPLAVTPSRIKQPTVFLGGATGMHGTDVRPTSLSRRNDTSSKVHQSLWKYNGDQSSTNVLKHKHFMGPEAKGQLVTCPHNPHLSMRSIRRISPYTSVNLDLSSWGQGGCGSFAICLKTYHNGMLQGICLVWCYLIYICFTSIFFRPSNLQVVNLRYWDAASHDIPWPTMKSKSLGSLQEGSQTQNTWEIQCKNLKCNPSRILVMDTCMVWSYSDMILRFWYADMINTSDHGETIILRSKRNELYPTPKVPFVFSRASFCSMHSLSCKLRIIEIIEPYWARQSHK